MANKGPTTLPEFQYGQEWSISREKPIHPLVARTRYYYQNLHLFHLFLLVIAPLLTILATTQIELQFQTFCVGLGFHVLCGLGITAGYHRLWSHRSYQACKPLRYFLAICGCGIVQGSVIEWVRHHRAHHRYVDTDKDPKNAKRGLFYSHMGWLITYTPQEWGPVDITDVEHDIVAQWQQRYYVPLVLSWGFLLPATLAHLITQDFSGGLLYGGCWRTIIGLHTTFLVNSVAHRTGDQPYTTNVTARDNYWLGLFTGGEGYHNFHHRFPSDYRNGVRGGALDVTKWFLWLCERLGLATDLICTSDKEIERALNRTQAETLVDQPDWNICNTVMSWGDYEERARTGRCLVCISGRVCDVTDFMYSHPGGQNTLQQAIGTDGTALFNSVDHSPYADQLLYSMQIATIDSNSTEGSLSHKNK